MRFAAQKMADDCVNTDLQPNNSQLALLLSVG